jgi:hypothetical protein
MAMASRAYPRFALAVLVGLGVAGGGASAYAEPPARTVAAQGAVVHAGALASDESANAQPSRQRFAFGDLYVPTFFHPVNGKYDLVLHFHGIPSLQETNFEKAKINAVVVSVNLGISSDAYSKMFKVPGAFDALVTQSQQALDKTGRAPGARLGRLALSAWSAGFAAVGAILKEPANADRVDAVLLADGPHAAYIAPHKIYDAGVEKWVNYAQAAMRGDKLFALTHSSIQTNGYPSTTETIGHILELTSVEKVANAAEGPRGMREIYESNRGNFHVAGYEGQTAKDHIDHIKGMADTLLPFLRARWSPAAAASE